MLTRILVVLGILLSFLQCSSDDPKRDTQAVAGQGGSDGGTAGRGGAGRGGAGRGGTGNGDAGSGDAGEGGTTANAGASPGGEGGEGGGNAAGEGGSGGDGTGATDAGEGGADAGEGGGGPDIDSNEPPSPTGTQGDAVGESHLKTFDGALYDFQALGEFTLLADPNDDLEVQIRTARASDAGNVAVIVALAMRVGGSKVSAYLDGTVRVDGEQADLSEGLTRLAEGGRLWKTGSQYVAGWSDGSQLRFALGSGFISLRVYLAGDRANADVLGLLGNFDGEPNGDVTTREGVVIDNPTPFLTFFGVYAESWRITPGDSLFDYEQGESSGDFTDRSFPTSVASVADVASAAQAAATETCETAGVAADWMDACVHDVGLTEAEAFAFDIASAGTPIEVTLVIEPPVACLPSDRTCVGSDVYVTDCEGVSTLVEACPLEAPCMSGFCIALTGAALRGLVRDATTSAPIVGAQVVIRQGNATVTALNTGETGLYSTELAPGIYELIISAPGYIEAYLTVELIAGEVTTVTGLRQVPASDSSAPGSIGGTISDSLTSVGAPGLALELRAGINATTGEVVATGVTDESGNYSIEDLPPGNYTLLAAGAGYADATFDVIVVAGVHTGGQNGSIAPLLPEGQTRIVLSWGAQPNDLDSHLYTPLIGTSSYHVYYSAPGSDVSAPYAVLDADDTSAYGPETITISQRFPGRYTYRVFNYSASPELTTSEARVDVYTEAGLERTYVVPTSGTGDWWTVFEIDGATGTLSGIGEISVN